MEPKIACHIGLTLQSIWVKAPQPPLVAERHTNSANMAPRAARQPTSKFIVKKIRPRKNALNTADFQFQRRMKRSTGCAPAQRRTFGSGMPWGGGVAAGSGMRKRSIGIRTHEPRLLHDPAYL